MQSAITVPVPLKININTQNKAEEAHGPHNFWIYKSHRYEIQKQLLQLFREGFIRLFSEENPHSINDVPTNPNSSCISQAKDLFRQAYSTYKEQHQVLHYEPTAEQ